MLLKEPKGSGIWTAINPPFIRGLSVKGFPKTEPPLSRLGGVHESAGVTVGSEKRRPQLSPPKTHLSLVSARLGPQSLGPKDSHQTTLFVPWVCHVFGDSQKRLWLFFRVSSLKKLR